MKSEIKLRQTGTRGLGITFKFATERKHFTDVIDMNQNPYDQTGRRVYGAELVEAFAKRFPQYTHKNDDFYNDGRTPTDGETSNPNPTLHSYQEISDDEAIAFSAGDYTPFGFLGGKKLRILPLGDSITYGFKSSDGNGYRQALKTILEGTGNTVEMIGTVQAGTMANNNNEGHNAATIDQVATYTGAYGQRPNVILLHVGTNDLNLHLDPSSAPQRLDSLVEKLISACPDATIIVARIIPSTDSGLASLISEYNKAITERMRDRALRREQNVIIVDMPSGVRVQDMADGLHPSDAGYDKMAVKWAIALTAANSMGWVQDPVAPTEVSVPSAPSCEREFVLHSQEVPLTQELFQSTKKCDIEMVKSPTATAVHFADLNGDGRVEYLHVDSIGAVTAFLNLGSPNQGGEAGKVTWLPQGTIATGVGGTRGSVQFADINGDGRAEYLWVHEDGSVDCWLNLGGPDNGPNAGKVGWLPQGTIATGIGKDGAGVRFADINGDGRAEYLYVYEDGSVEAYLNAGGPDNGPNAAKVIWLPQGKIATGVGMGRENVIFADVNGDKRADYLAVSRTDGSVKLWRNGGPLDKGSNDAKVVWIERGTIATGVGTNGKGVQFADLNGDRRADC
ncbi:hypothetical protein M7I_7089 [Glarea lozoyensis 74030]|uniref:SGNH hydrolase-type esterase domain-containing protein n=1 Tax=Glarea lozoyensis (strain ATCC 74030 / MF5533) TaxID=1104152 RepID=H0EWC6_GLAL7|nr:hypothetical protein M7I_7089 [Glarea lozoyensis 74030]